MPNRRNPSDLPLVPLTDSHLRTAGMSWLTSPSYRQSSLSFSATAFHSVTDVLLENPNLNSSHLFRADIIFDSTGILKTNREKEDFRCIPPSNSHLGCEEQQLKTSNEDEALPPLPFPGFELRRTILRRLIPRKPQLDQSLLQTCHIYTAEDEDLADFDEVPSSEKAHEHVFAPLSLDEKLRNKSVYRQAVAHHSQHLVVYQPHADPLTGKNMPWYHPPLKSLAFLYRRERLDSSEEQNQTSSALSVHFRFFSGSCPADDPRSITDRVHRTLLSLLSTFTRLVRNTPVCLNIRNKEERPTRNSAMQYIKDNIIPEHLVQNTYSRLKTQYAADLINRWVEKTDPSKHVFEDLSIAAFLLELWRKMYGNNPTHFPGFVDIACGNGVLVYILRMEGFRGWGFDARARRTWSIFPTSITACLKQSVCIPRPFLEALHSIDYPLPEDLLVHNGIFEQGTFIVSNHADELTTWTPLLAALSCPESPLPWLAIPCCSHALSGAANRYPSVLRQPGDTKVQHNIKKLGPGNDADTSRDEQPRTGDLAALRASKDPAPQSSERKSPSGTKSAYASLVDQVISLATKLDPTEDVEKTLMRIPSTRNIGIVGGQLRGLSSKTGGEGPLMTYTSNAEQLEREKRADLTRKTVREIVEQECMRSGGVEDAATIWMGRVRTAIGTTRHTFESG
ncbi:hypothetical protein EPUS_03334 [Endocarpon pusillum Z07020]|uniref:tRNA (uracil-O(2)-)-methyltransferase n=1 Tax=Endocarpon pusillum (strain Z07020 / HMAS-L-300199) TaxID=1263415 RepID=U1HPR4_ENDPU|nr:uncharacterized protein EPUS_03334 [Endocarpon pusillum Z07020]ERF71054.1 hypothetical protein EPUS_03334 [Endocarpon pusillum Z07020]